jgi:hypothetical protein
LQSFFLTAKVLHLGPVAVLSFRNRLMKQLQRTEEEAKVLERMLPRCGSAMQWQSGLLQSHRPLRTPFQKALTVYEPWSTV